MAVEIKLPKLGENLEEATVLEVKVAAGEQVSKGQSLLDVEADKVSTDVSAEQAGKVTKVLIKKGDRIRTGQVLFQIEAGADGGTKPAAPTKQGAPSPPAPKAAQTPPAAEKPSVGPANDKAATVVMAPAARDADKLVPAGPATRRLARELGIDLTRVTGSATGGRVTQEDVKAFVRQLASGTVGGAGPAALRPLPDFSKWGAIDRQPLDSIRRKTAEQMSLSWSQVARVTQDDVADTTLLDAFRRKQEGKKLTVTAFALKACAILLEQFPTFNSTLDWGNNQLILKHYYNIGVAVDTERGLLVPVIRDVGKKSVTQLGEELAAVAEKARQKKVTGDDLRGGTFTITNLGGIGGTGFTPIINYPEVAILGMSRARLQPAVFEGQIVPRLLLPLSLSYDHRVIDGADAARFTRRLAEMLENPLQMLLHA
jgi:pyruvate dehydrogenase E2 component (dihydrolipoyllysine-residue acetyltransferase)